MSSVPSARVTRSGGPIGVQPWRVTTRSGRSLAIQRTSAPFWQDLLAVEDGRAHEALLVARRPADDGDLRAGHPVDPLDELLEVAEERVGEEERRGVGARAGLGPGGAGQRLAGLVEAPRQVARRRDAEPVRPGRHREDAHAAAEAEVLAADDLARAGAADEERLAHHGADARQERGRS